MNKNKPKLITPKQTENSNTSVWDVVKKQVEKSIAQYFSMPDNVFNSGTGCQDSTTK